MADEKLHKVKLKPRQTHCRQPDSSRKGSTGIFLLGLARPMNLTLRHARSAFNNIPFLFDAAGPSQRQHRKSRGGAETELAP
ncbi:hypothetical protein CRG98_033975 [Punica granatum]|uniref:Uncharacterized protein n=1 Tax=Punica granatum TaxID=22663 RepID=A0A2I0INS7_PUNGR|nr:hypothetical protein CRG98_033975 [Punica granatum]